MNELKRYSLLLALATAFVAALPVACGSDKPDDEIEDPLPDGKCTVDTDCTDGGHCGPAGECVECASDGHCDRVEMCDPGSLTCTFRDGWGDECETHDDCSLGMWCSQGLCMPEEQVTRCGPLKQCLEGQRCNRDLDVCEEDLGCFEDDDCSEGEVCNIGLAQCEPRCTPETELTICSVGERCENGHCVECTEDADCGPGLTCDVDAGRCAGSETCFTDRDCEAGKICNRATKTCTLPPPPCQSDDDCLEDEQCDLQRRRCVLRECQPDLYESNDSEEEATTITAGSVFNLTVCGTEEDWYRIVLQRGDRINVNIETDVLTAGGLDAQIRDGNGRVLDADPLLLDVVVAEDGPYYLRVRTGDEQAKYALHVLVARGVPCDDDGFEPNQDYTVAGELSAGETRNLQACPADPDWYVVEVPSGRGLRVQLTHEPLQGDIDLVVYDSDGRSQIGAARTTNAVEQVDVAGVSGGRAYLLVIPSNDRTQNAYDLSVAVQ